MKKTKYFAQAFIMLLMSAAPLAFAEKISPEELTALDGMSCNLVHMSSASFIDVTLHATENGQFTIQFTDLSDLKTPLLNNPVFNELRDKDFVSSTVSQPSTLRWTYQFSLPNGMFEVKGPGLVRIAAGSTQEALENYMRQVMVTPLNATNFKLNIFAQRASYSHRIGIYSIVIGAYTFDSRGCSYTFK